MGPVPPSYALQSSLLPLSYRDRVHQHRRSLTTHSGSHTLGLALRDRLAPLALQRTRLLRLIQAAVTLGLLGYHRPWIPNFSKIAKPLTDLLGKGREFAWDQICEDAVKKLIGLVISEPVIVPPDPDRQ